MAISVPSKNTFLIWSTSKTTFCQNVPHPHLHHLGMDVEAGVAQLSDLLGQELHPLSGVTEDNGLVDLKLWRKEEKTQRMCYRPSLWSDCDQNSKLANSLLKEEQRQDRRIKTYFFNNYRYAVVLFCHLPTFTMTRSVFVNIRLEI